MPFASKFIQLKESIYTTYGKDPAKMLLHTGAWGWILASLGQVAAVIINDKIPKEQKKFLIPQEIADAAVNIAAFYTITRLSTKIGEKLVSTGKIITKPIAEFVEKETSKTENKIKIGDIKTNIEEIINNDADIKKKYYGFKTGIKVIFSTTGAVVSSNFLTPYIRNKIGANHQKRELSKGIDNHKIVKRPRITLNDYRQKISTNPIFQKGSMKI